MINPTKEYHQGKSRLVFAGQESLNGYQQVAVRYEKNEKTETKLSRNPRQLTVRLPDRTVFICSKSSNRNIILDEKVDLVISTKRDLNQHIEMGTDMLLFNPIHAPSTMDTRPYLRAGIDVLVDSGGFQLAQGTSDFVSPEDTAAFYTKHASIGVGLDFPAPPYVDELLYKENCKLQALNNAKMRTIVPEYVSIAPVIHGATPITREHCMNSVYKKGRDKAVAIAGLISRRGDSVDIVKQRMAALALVLDKTRKDILYYHMLGATSSWMLALYALMAQTGYVISMGGDSVSHRQSAIGGAYKLAPYFTGAVSLTQPVETNVCARLPCSCPACVAVGDARLMRDFRLSELHHLYAAHQQKVAIDHNVDAYIKGRINRTELWKFVIGDGSKAYHMIPNTVFDYFEKVIAKGYENVPKLAPHEGFGKKQSLFGGSALTKQQQTVIERYKTIHKVYEKYHKVSLSKT